MAYHGISVACLYLLKLALFDVAGFFVETNVFVLNSPVRLEVLAEFLVIHPGLTTRVCQSVPNRSKQFACIWAFNGIYLYTVHVLSHGRR